MALVERQRTRRQRLRGQFGPIVIEHAIAVRQADQLHLGGQVRGARRGRDEHERLNVFVGFGAGRQRRRPSVGAIGQRRRGERAELIRPGDDMFHALQCIGLGGPDRAAGRDVVIQHE